MYDSSDDEADVGPRRGWQWFDYPIQRNLNAISAVVPPPPFYKRRVGRLFVYLYRTAQPKNIVTVARGVGEQNEADRACDVTTSDHNTRSKFEVSVGSSNLSKSQPSAPSSAEITAPNGTGDNTTNVTVGIEKKDIVGLSSSANGHNTVVQDRNAGEQGLGQNTSNTLNNGNNDLEFDLSDTTFQDSDEEDAEEDIRYQIQHEQNVTSARASCENLPQIMCVLGPCWPMVFVTTGLIICVSLFVFSSFFSYISGFLVVASVGSLVLTLLSFFMTACRDPGVVPRWPKRYEDELNHTYGHSEILTGRREWFWSEQAHSLRTRGIQFDSETQVLARDVDHFCPWTGTLIASGNIKPFYVFVASLLVLSVMLVVVSVAASNSEKFALDHKGCGAHIRPCGSGSNTTTTTRLLRGADY